MQVNREEVKMLALSVGVREAARQLGLNENTVRQWSKRGQWLKPQALPLSVIKQSGQSVTSVTSPSVILADTLAQRKHDSAQHLSKYILDASEKLAKSKGALKHSRPGKDIVAMRSGIWPEQQGQAAFSLNVLNLGGSVQIGVRADSVDAVAQPQGLVDSLETD